MIVKLKISDIVIPQGFLPRVLTGTVAEVVERYREAYEVGENLPPIKVWRRGNGYWLIDGVHRLTAIKELGREYIEAELVECKDELDFRVKAIQENIKHGLALSLEEIKENARLLFKAGLKDVEELARVFKKSERTIYRYVEDLIEEEKEALRKRVLELRESGLKIKEIADKTGLSESHVKRMLSEGIKIDKMSKMILSLPPTKEGLRLLSDWLESIDPQEDDFTSKWLEFVGAKAQSGEAIEGNPAEFITWLVGETKRTMEGLADMSWSVVERAITELDFVKELSPRARKVWLERARKLWDRMQEDRQKRQILERLVLQRAEEVLRDAGYIFSSWRNLAHALRSKYAENFRETTESVIQDILSRYSDRLMAIYEEIPELTQEEWEQIADRKMNYDEAVEVAKKHGKRLPYAVWQVWHSKQEALSSPTSLPPSDLAGSQPALSNIQVSDDDWADWNDEDNDEVQGKVQEKEKRQEKKEVKLVPPEEELERLAGDIYRIVAIVMERYSIEVIEEWWEEIEKEVREAIEIRRKREGK